MRQRDTPNGVVFTTKDGLDIDIVLIGEHDGYQFLSVSTPSKRVDIRISPKGHSIQHWLVNSPLTAGMIEHRKRGR